MKIGKSEDYGAPAGNGNEALSGFQLYTFDDHRDPLPTANARRC